MCSHVFRGGDDYVNVAPCFVNVAPGFVNVAPCFVNDVSENGVTDVIDHCDTGHENETYLLLVSVTVGKNAVLRACPFLLA